ncbi:MAG: helix-turn-helix domain-containing protein [Anaerolineales bacterium]|nr:helix-turn-helix domain-containing protein [Anaerolineales bacterium]
MRGRKPRPVKLKRKDVTELRTLLRDGHTLQRVAQRARILLTRAEGTGVAAVAAKVDQDPATVWRVCERYRRHGLQAALHDAPRTGRPRTFFQPPTHSVETSGAASAAHGGLGVDALVDPQSGPRRRRARPGAAHPPGHRLSAPAGLRSAAAPVAQLEDHDLG